MAKEIRISKNGGYSKKAFMIDSTNYIFEVSVDVYFDPELDDFRDYNGKKVEIILKADQRFEPNTNQFALDEYYFVGIGTWEFDVGLGVAKFDALQNKTYKSFLAAFGNYNTKNIKTGMWYTLKANVIEDKIKIFFNERGNDEKLVISYDISKDRHLKEERYLRGEFEELVYVVSGLENLDIIYPDKLLQATNPVVSKRIYNEEIVRSVRPVGPLSGIVVFNPFSYITNITYRSKSQGDDTFDGPTETIDWSFVISDIRKKYKDFSDEIVNVGKTLNQTLVIQIENNLYYKLKNGEVNLFSNEVDKFFVSKNRVIVKFLETNKNTLLVLNENFNIIKNLFVRDNGFNEDHVYKYLQLTNRGIEDVFVNGENIHVVFEDIE